MRIPAKRARTTPATPAAIAVMEVLEDDDDEASFSLLEPSVDVEVDDDEVEVDCRSAEAVFMSEVEVDCGFETDDVSDESDEDGGGLESPSDGKETSTVPTKTLVVECVVISRLCNSGCRF